MDEVRHAARLQTTLRAVVTPFPDAAALAAAPSVDGEGGGEQCEVTVDLFRSRVHVFCAADVRAVRRVGRSGRALCVVPQRRGQPALLLVFRTAADREHCLEAILLLLSRRCVFAGVDALAPREGEERDVVVEHVPPGEERCPRLHPTCVLSASAAVLRCLRLWVGTDDGRMRFQHRAFDVIAVLGRDDRTGWEEKTLRAAGLAQVARVPVASSPGRRCLYVFVSEAWMPSVDDVRVASGDTAAVALRILESLFLFVAADAAAVDDFVDVDEYGEASDLPTAGPQRLELPPSLRTAPTAVDVVEQHDVVFAVRHRPLSALRGAEVSACGQAPVQARGRGEYGFRALRTSYFHVEGDAAVMNHAVSLFDRPGDGDGDGDGSPSAAALPSVELLTLSVSEAVPGAVDIPGGAAALGLGAASLAANCPFATDPATPSRITLLHTGPDLVFAGGCRTLFVAIAGVGTAAVPFLDLGGGTVSASVMNSGEAVATASLSAILRGCDIPC